MSTCAINLQVQLYLFIMSRRARNIIHIGIRIRKSKCSNINKRRRILTTNHKWKGMYG